DQRGSEVGAAHSDGIALDAQRSRRGRPRRPDPRPDVPSAGPSRRGARQGSDAIRSLPGARDRTGGLLEPHELQAWRLLHAAPQPYTRERFEDTYAWTVRWNMTVPGATYENTVDNRAWQ